MWIEDFEVWLCIVYLIFCLDCIEKSLKLNQSTVFLLDEDDFGDSSKIGEDVVETIMVILFRQWSGEKYFRGTILLHELFGMRIDNGFWFLSVALCGFLPNFELLAFKCYLPELLIDVHEVVEGAILLGFDGWFGLGFVFGWSGAKSGFIIHYRSIDHFLLFVERNYVILEGASSFSVGGLVAFLSFLLLLQHLVVDSP